MILKLADKFTEKLMEMQIVKNEDKELYAYGFWQGFVILINLITVAVMGLLFGMLWQSLAFTAAYGLLRHTAGGYHARTPQRCYVLSVLLIAAVLALLKWVPWSGALCLPLIALSGAVIFILAPVEDENKPLDDLEIVVYKKRARIIYCILAAAAALALPAGYLPASACITISIFASAVMVLLGGIKNRMNSA